MSRVEAKKPRVTEKVESFSKSLEPVVQKQVSLTLR